MAVIKLVQGDTKPTLLVDVKDANTGLPIDISTSTTRLKIRMSMATTIKETLTGTLLPGLTAGDMLGEVEVTFADSSIQSVYEVLKFKVREQFVP